VADLVRDRQLLARCRESAEKVAQRGLGETLTAWLQQEQTRLKLAEIS